MIDIAHSMGKVVTAEGIETSKQADLLGSLGCDYLQGWYFAKAQNLERLPYVIENLPNPRSAPGRLVRSIAS